MVATYPRPRPPLTKLTEAQVARLPEIRDEWLDVFLGAGQTDRGRAEDAIVAAYGAAGLEAPKRFVWVASPKEGARVADVLARHAEQGLPGYRDSFAAGPLATDRIGRSPLVALRNDLRSVVGGKVIAQLEEEVLAHIPDHQLLGHSWFSELNRDFLREDAPYGLVESPVADEWRDAVHQMLLGRSGGPSIGYAAAMARPSAWALAKVPAAMTGQDGAAIWACLAALHEFGALDSAWLKAQLDIARLTSWWWPFMQTVVVSDRPVIHRLDAELRLHGGDGPALAFADGTCVWAWHGRWVPADLILSGWSADRILAERNAEVRRCAIEKLGWEHFIADGDFRQVGEAVDDPGNPGCTLALYDVPAAFDRADPIRLLVCTNGTPEADGSRRTFGLTVPSFIDDPLTAAAWTFDLSPAEYASLVRAS